MVRPLTELGVDKSSLIDLKTLPCYDEGNKGQDMEKIISDVFEGYKTTKRDMQEKGLLTDFTTYEEIAEYAGSHIKITPYQPERSKREDPILVEFSTDISLGFLTSNGLKIMSPGKIYDENLNEIRDAVL